MLLILNQGIPKNPHQRGNAMFHVAPTTKTILHKQIHFVKEEILEGCRQVSTWYTLYG